MEIVVEGADIDFDQYDFNNLGEVFDIIDDNNHIIMKVIADDVDITECTNHEIENVKPIKQLRIVVQEKKELIKDSIEEARDYLPKLTAGIDTIIEKFTQGEEMEAFEMLSDGIEGFQWLNLFINNLNEMSLTSKEIETDYKEWQEILPDLLTALENKDMVLVTDLLEYEIKPFLISFEDSLSYIDISDY